MTITDGVTNEMTNMHEFEARKLKAKKIATVCRKQRWTAADLVDFGPARLSALAKICDITYPSPETLAMAQGMLIEFPGQLMSAEEMIAQEAAFDAHILGRR